MVHHKSNSSLPWHHAFVPIAFTALLFACHSMDPESRVLQKKDFKPATSDVNCSPLEIVGGKDTKDFASVVLISRPVGSTSVSSCSATFVGPNSMITAGHCVDPNDLTAVRVFGESLSKPNYMSQYNAAPAPIKVLHHGRAFIGSDMNTANPATLEHDMVIMIFKDDIANSFIPLGSVKPKVGEVVDLVGFGSNIFGGSDPNHVYRRQTGRNTIADFTPFGSNAFGIIGLQNTTDVNNVLASFGDSGGALIFNGKLVGVTSMITAVTATEGAVFYVDLSLAHNKDLIAQAKAAGAKFEANPIPVPNPLPTPNPSPVPPNTSGVDPQKNVIPNSVLKNPNCKES